MSSIVYRIKKVPLLKGFTVSNNIPPHIQAKRAYSEAVLELAYEIANDTFDQKWSNAGTNLLTTSLAHLCSEAVYLDRQLDTIEVAINQDEIVTSILRALSKSEEGLSLLAEQVQPAENTDLAAVLQKLAQRSTRSIKLADLSSALSMGGDHAAITGVVIAVLSKVHSSYNTNVHSQGSGTNAYNTVQQLRKEMEMTLYSACLQGTNPIEISGIIVLYANELLTCVVELTRAARDGTAELNELCAKGSGTAAEKLGKTVAKWGSEIRQTMASLTSASALCLGGFTRQYSYLTDPEKLLHRAFDFAIPDGKNTEIGDLQEGKLADITGRVTDIKVRRKGNHLITTIDLLDPSSGKSATVALSFVNGINMGITLGAFVSCTGIYHSKSTLNQDNSAFHVEQLPLASLAKSSWRAGFLALGSTFMEVWPNGHLVHWTIGPHTSTVFEELGTGAGEVLFRLTPNITGKW